MNGLTVIATNNGFDYLEKSLESEKKFGKWPVTVIDTASTDTSFSAFAIKACKNYGAEYIRLREPLYDFGAYKYAVYDEYPDVDMFWLRHDSLYLKSTKFYDIIENGLKSNDMIGWHFFARWGSSFDNDEQRQWLIDQFGADDYDYGFYGPNIAVKRSTLDKLENELRDVVVDDKIKQQAMERGWAILGKKYNMKMMFLEHYKGDVQGDNYTFFKKATHQSGVPRK